MRCGPKNTGFTKSLDARSLNVGRKRQVLFFESHEGPCANVLIKLLRLLKEMIALSCVDYESRMTIAAMSCSSASLSASPSWSISLRSASSSSSCYRLGRLVASLEHRNDNISSSSSNNNNIYYYYYYHYYYYCYCYCYCYYYYYYS